MTEFGGRSIGNLSVSHEANVDRFTGAAFLRVPIPSPPGRESIGLGLALTYSSSAGNSPYGIGWSLDGLPVISLSTRREVPRWDGTDGYQLNRDELVTWLEPDGAGKWRPRGFEDGDWSVAFYRVRTGSPQIRVEKWVHRPTGRVHFRTRDAQNALTIYGARPGAAARIADSGDEARTFQWLPELKLDAFGNVLWVEYVAETLDGVDRAAPYERRRPALAQRYLKRIRYCHVAPLAGAGGAGGPGGAGGIAGGPDDALLSGELPADSRWCFQLVFDYGDHADPDRPGAVPDRAWPARADAVSSCRAGFDLRTYRLCRRVLSFHEFDELGPGPTLVGALVLRHDEDPAGSTLREIRWIGHRRDGDVHSTRSLPPLRLTYSPAVTDTAFTAAPAETQENVPAGLAGPRYALVDLLGDGLPGILAESDRAWFYKPNLGEGRFGAQALILERPATRAGTFAFGDLDRDGDTDLSRLAGRMAGSFEHDRETARWRPFRPIPALPHVEGLNGRAEWLDLNGDGRPEIVVAKDDRLVWFPAEDDGGFGDPIEVPLPPGARSAPTLAADAALDLFFADMNGDGLPDLVRITNGRVEYWPSLGHGRFGDAVTLEDAPRFAPEGEFDAGRLRFVDLDGSGTTDLVYLGHGEVTAWINASGNRLVPGPRLRGLPYFDSFSTARLLDFLGDGRLCLVWSSPLPGRESPMQYLPLAGPDRPRLLLSVDDSVGMETRFAYSSSAAHYLRDARAGEPWVTRLPSHVTVVARREVLDQIGRTRNVQRFEYRDGFFDGEEREFRGFGRVDVYDADAAAQSGGAGGGRGEGGTGSGAQPPPGEVPAAPPSLVRTWFHLGTGTSRGGPPPGAYAGDPALPVLTPHVIQDEGELAPAELHDALRALAGEELRRETYALDERGRRGDHPIDVLQTTCRVRRQQPARGGDPATFSTLAEEALTAIYEQSPGDPRISQYIVLEADELDDVPLRQAEIAYLRRAGVPRDVAAQDELRVLVHDYERLHFDAPSRNERGIPLGGRDLELLGLAPGPAGRFTRARLLEADVAAALAEPRAHHEEPGPGVSARLLAWERSFYWDDERGAPLPHGQVGRLTLVHHEEAACFAPALIEDVFGSRVDAATLEGLGYVLRDGFWWQFDDVHLFGGPELFFQRVGLESSEGGRSSLDYDDYALEIVSETDPLGNRTAVETDYHVLAPARITDPNGNTSEVRYDPLGVLVAASRQGHVGDEPWGFDVLADVEPRTPANLAELIATPAQFLQGATRFVFYDVDAWARDRTPPVVATLAAEGLRRDGRGGGGATGRIQVTVAYVDGLGRTLQS
ncbi:MAG: SpvB/TcaC N-terminal domain-containing protein, partial [Candidatus Eiseniibacteriota bacterium]